MEQKKMDGSASQKISKQPKMEHWVKNDKADSKESAFFIFKRV